MLAGLSLGILFALLQAFHGAPEAPQTAERGSSQAVERQQNTQNNQKRSAKEPHGAVAAIDAVESRHVDSKTEARSAEVQMEINREIAKFTRYLVGVGLLQALILGFQAWYLRRTIKSAERTLLLTERADLMLESIHISPENRLGTDTVIRLVFKNYGRTRANDVQVRFRLVAPGTQASEAPPSPLVAIAAGKDLYVPFRPLGEHIREEIIARIAAGELQLRFEGYLGYRDVFGLPHRSHSSGTYLPNTGTFRLDEQQAD